VERTPRGEIAARQRVRRRFPIAILSEETRAGSDVTIVTVHRDVRVAVGSRGRDGYS